MTAEQKTGEFRKGLTLVLLAWGLLFGNAYNTYVDYHFTHSTDSRSYLQMAQGNLNVNPTHRYRILVPLCAAVVAKITAPFYNALWQFREDPVWPYKFGFFVVNSLIMALAGAIIFLTCRAYGSGIMPSLLALIAILSSRWANYMAALPLTDSLYFLTLAMTLYGVRAQKSWPLLLATVLGPLAKESFLLVVPLLFLSPLGWRKQLALVFTSLILTFTVRWGIDHHLGKPITESWVNALSHANGISYSLRRLFLQRLGEKFSVLGIFTVILIAGFTGGKTGIKSWLIRMDKACLGLTLVTLAQALLSGDIGRMLFLGSPIWAVASALILEHHPLFAGLRTRLRESSASL